MPYQTQHFLSSIIATEEQVLKVPITPNFFLTRNKSIYRTGQKFRKNLVETSIFFVNFQSRQKTPQFETLPSGKSLKLGLGRLRFMTPFQDFSCKRAD